jgi:hypothetical protein
MEYEIKAETLGREVTCTTDYEGKIIDIPMPDVEGDLPNLRIEATSPIEAIRKYWLGLTVEPRAAKLTVRRMLVEQDEPYVSNHPKTYIVNWAAWNECGCGQTGWWVLRNEKEYEQLRDDKGNALFELPRYRLLKVE